jgi:hypothetical protein
LNALSISRTLSLPAAEGEMDGSNKAVENSFCFVKLALLFLPRARLDSRRKQKHEMKALKPCGKAAQPCLKPCYDESHMERSMPWYHYVSYFFGSAFIANSLPHLGNGISGRPFQSPFAKPPGEGLSSSTVNVLWGFFNLAVAYVLILRVGSFSLHNTCQMITFGAGMLVVALMMARAFGRFHGGNLHGGIQP